MFQGQRLAVTSPADQIAGILKSEILEGQYPPGTRLMQEDLCSRFEISRTPVREALRILQAQNLIVITPNRSVTVRLPKLSQLREIYAVRSELEGYATRLASQNASAENLRTLSENLLREIETAEFARATLENDHKALAELHLVSNDKFHETIHELSGNTFLAQTISELRTHFPKTLSNPNSLDQIIVLHDHSSAHRAIVDALITRDGELASALMTAHIVEAGNVLFTILEERGLIGQDKN